MTTAVRVYPSPIGPPTLAQWLIDLAAQHTVCDTATILRKLDPVATVLRDALAEVLGLQIEIVRDHVASRDDDDAWHYRWGLGYRAWLSGLDNARDALDDVPLEPNFDD